jgi:transcriptional regulator with XRE-family HTH domain
MNLTDEIEKDARQKRLLEQERLILQVTERICAIMEEQKVTRSCLAKRLNRSKGYVSQLLDGSRNMTLRTLADVLTALERRGEFQARPRAPVHSVVNTQFEFLRIPSSCGSLWRCSDETSDEWDPQDYAVAG